MGASSSSNEIVRLLQAKNANIFWNGDNVYIDSKKQFTISDSENVIIKPSGMSLKKSKVLYLPHHNHVVTGKSGVMLAAPKYCTIVNGNCQVYTNDAGDAVAICAGAEVIDKSWVNNIEYEDSIYHFVDRQKYSYYAHLYNSYYLIGQDEFLYKESTPGNLESVKTGQLTERVDAPVKAQKASFGYNEHFKQISSSVWFIRNSIYGTIFYQSRDKMERVGPFVKVADKMYYIHRLTLDITNFDDENDVIAMIPSYVDLPRRDYDASRDNIVDIDPAIAAQRNRVVILQYQGEEFAFDNKGLIAYEIRRLLTPF